MAITVTEACNIILSRLSEISDKEYTDRQGNQTNRRKSAEEVATKVSNKIAFGSEVSTGLMTFVMDLYRKDLKGQETIEGPGAAVGDLYHFVKLSKILPENLRPKLDALRNEYLRSLAEKEKEKEKPHVATHTPDPASVYDFSAF